MRGSHPRSQGGTSFQTGAWTQATPPRRHCHPSSVWSQTVRAQLCHWPLGGRAVDLSHICEGAVLSGSELRWGLDTGGIHSPAHSLARRSTGKPAAAMMCSEVCPPPPRGQGSAWDQGSGLFCAGAVSHGRCWSSNRTTRTLLKERSLCLGRVGCVEGARGDGQCGVDGVETNGDLIDNKKEFLGAWGPCTPGSLQTG